LKSGTVEFASLDHDLADEHYFEFDAAEYGGKEYDTKKFKERTGYDVLLWMQEHNVWPKLGVRIHTMNTVRKPIMLDIVRKHYGRTFQFQYQGTHTV
jgi:NAD+-processing family protein with receiver domain